MAPFDKAAEHEYLVNMYKLRGSYVSHGVHLERIHSMDSRKLTEMRRESFSVQVYDALQRGLKRGVNLKDMDSQRYRRERRLYKYSVTNSRILIPPQVVFWDYFVATLVILQVLYLPYVLAFEFDGGKALFYLELIVDILFCIDMIIQFNVAYAVEDNSSTNMDEERSKFEKEMERDEIVHLETGRKKIALNYLQGWFIIDFLAIVPLFVTSQAGLSLTKTLRLPRIFRLLNVARVFNSLR